MTTVADTAPATVLVVSWTARHATALRQAMRLSNVDFAAHLGVSLRTVATWSTRPGIEPRAEVQQLLDTALAAASVAVAARFTHMLGNGDGLIVMGDAR